MCLQCEICSPDEGFPLQLHITESRGEDCFCQSVPNDRSSDHKWAKLKEDLTHLIQFTFFLSTNFSDCPCNWKILKLCCELWAISRRDLFKFSLFLPCEVCKWSKTSVIGHSSKLLFFFFLHSCSSNLEHFYKTLLINKWGGFWNHLIDYNLLIYLWDEIAFKAIENAFFFPEKKNICYFFIFHHFTSTFAQIKRSYVATGIIK